MFRKKTTAYGFTLLATLLALGLSGPASAQDDDLLSRFSGVAQLDVTNAYYFRGILQEREGVQIEPWTELYINLYSSEDGFLRDATIGGGVWLSFQSERTCVGCNPQSPQWLYEGDYYPLLSLGFAGNLTLNTTYYWYSSPNDAFATAQELDFKLLWDDSEVFGRWAMAPWINLAIETHNTAFGPDEGQAVQMGIGPTIYAAEDESFTLTAPAELGLAIDDYYESASGAENTFGYANVGLLLSVPLSFIPESAGAWTFSMSGKYFFFSSDLEAANRGRSTYPVGMASLGVSF